MKEGRINKIQLRRSMSPTEVKQMISKTSASFNAARCALFVKCTKSSSLEVFGGRMLTGDEVPDLAGNGSLYLLEVSLAVLSAIYDTVAL